jgi:hypothetical protein
MCRRKAANRFAEEDIVEEGFGGKIKIPGKSNLLAMARL